MSSASDYQNAVELCKRKLFEKCHPVASYCMLCGCSAARQFFLLHSSLHGSHAAGLAERAGLCKSGAWRNS